LWATLRAISARRRSKTAHDKCITRCGASTGFPVRFSTSPGRPEEVDIVLLNRPELPPAGTGESSIRPVAAAIANAIFDATGVRP